MFRKPAAWGSQPGQGQLHQPSADDVIRRAATARLGAATTVGLVHGVVLVQVVKDVVQHEVVTVFVFHLWGGKRQPPLRFTSSRLSNLADRIG